MSATMGAAALLLLIAAAEPVKLAAPAFKCADVGTEKCEFYADFLAQQLEVAGVKVISERQLQALLGLDRQKQLLGCTEDTHSRQRPAGPRGTWASPGVSETRSGY